MIYVFDTSSFGVVGNYYPDRFPSFWQAFNDLVGRKTIISVREVKNELGRKNDKGFLEDWAKKNSDVFLTPSEEEMRVVKDIFAEKRFQALVRRQEILEGRPVADPFIIACAKSRGGCVVSEERFRPNAAKIPNICQFFGVEYTNVQGFLAKNGMKF